MDFQKISGNYKGVTSASLLAAAGKKFVDKDDWIRFLEGVFLLGTKDALCVIDDVGNYDIANADAAKNAVARAVALLTTIQLAQPAKPEKETTNAVQEPGPTPEVSPASGGGEDGPSNSEPVGGGDQEPAPETSPKPRKGPKAKKA